MVSIDGLKPAYVEIDPDNYSGDFVRSSQNNSSSAITNHVSGTTSSGPGHTEGIRIPHAEASERHNLT